MTVTYNQNGCVANNTNTAYANTSASSYAANTANLLETIRPYVDWRIEEKTKEIESRIAERTYSVISEMIECNIRKEEFIKLLIED
jgi:hypothetical protein